MRQAGGTGTRSLCLTPQPRSAEACTERPGPCAVLHGAAEAVSCLWPAMAGPDRVRLAGRLEVGTPFPVCCPTGMS